MDTDMPAEAEPKPLIMQPAEPSAPALDPAQLQQLAGDNPMLALGLAAVAVLGGGAAWKHWGKMSEQRHEQAMKALEIEAQKAQVPNTQPPPCQAANAQIEARLAAMEGRIGKAERGLSLGGELPEELEERIKKLEKAAKKAAK
jgi:hypothetical protein